MGLREIHRLEKFLLVFCWFFVLFFFLKGRMYLWEGKIIRRDRERVKIQVRGFLKILFGGTKLWDLVKERGISLREKKEPSSFGCESMMGADADKQPNGI